MNRDLANNNTFEQDTGISRFFLFLIRYSTYAVLFTPLIISSKFYFPFVGPKSLYFMGLAEIIIFSWLALLFLSKKYRPKINLVLLSILLFFGILILSAVFGANFSSSFWSKFERMTGILMWFHLLGFFLVISSVFQKEEEWQKIFAVSIFVALIVSILSLLGKGGSTRGGATIGNTSFMGTYLLFNIFLPIYLFFKKKHISWKICSVVSFLIIALALWKSTAIAALLSFFGGLALLLIFYLCFEAKRKLIRYSGRIILVLVVLVFLTTSVLLFVPESPVRQKFVETATESRFVVWKTAFQGFLERPILGWGPENFDLVFTKNFNPCMFLGRCGSEIWFDRAHNIVFDTLVSSGILGLLSYIGIFIISLFTLFKKYLKTRIGFFTAFIPFVILISYSVQNLTVFDMISSYMMFFLILGFIRFIDSLKPEETKLEIKEKIENRRFIETNKWFLGFLIPVFVLSSFFFVIQPIRSGKLVISAITSKDYTERKEFFQKTLDASPLGKFQIREFFAGQIEQSVRANINKIPKDIAIQELDFAVELLERNRAESPLDFRSILKLGHLYNLFCLFDASKVQKAEQALNEAIELSPTNQQGYWAFSQTKIIQQDYETALSLAEKAIELEPELLESHRIAVQVARISGNMEKAREFIKEAIEINPEWENELEGFLSQ